MWVTKVLKSFRYALEGLKFTVVTQRNMRIHFLAALGVLLLSLYLPMSKTEVLLLFVTIILVLFAELINTAVEAVVDMVTEEYHPLAKVAKDVAAGAVLLTAGLAVIVGISVFYPYLNTLFQGLIGESADPADIGFAAIIAFDFFFTLMIKGWLHRMGKSDWEPSMTTSIAFCVATLIVAVIGSLILTLLVYFLTALIVGSRLRLQPNRLSIFLGMVLGTSVAFIGVQLL
ncbi:diacylglycerol kinase family protein [Lihuaxuella thermophila]|uniref:Undecaprenol kinase/diacylglycerol kinase (ATP) n=1 Tax=Lihuaxuella thermophila TaxID=1173111 RepID=A0A1H8DBG1_9BACL|nr:diacylglycerol kinase family protein [Lihuaxuella thermophila]SEN04612.1 undecaprenol kinase/diacylglycerol kinase (ATP) [Lihuaxuella thermophila]